MSKRAGEKPHEEQTICYGCIFRPNQRTEQLKYNISYLKFLSIA